ncbi:MAG: calcium/proton exchanger [Deltaproteobacteria bacterium]|nr:calcium/proton exchanger [Deltaproteobacteria bacterium]
MTATAQTAPRPASTADRVFNLLLAVCLPGAILSPYFLGGTATFLFCVLALLPLARLMGEATEVVAHHLGAGLGGLMNASFGNAAELIIAIAALRSGQVEVVKASITGAILGNLLLVLGAAIFAGGLSRSRKKQVFNTTAALSGSGMMFLAVSALLVPDIFHVTRGAAAEPVMQKLSVSISVVLLLIYGASLVFSLGTHKHLYDGEEQEELSEDALPPWSTKKATVILLAATLGVIVVAEFLVHALEDAIRTFGFTHTFVGVIVIAIAGNAAEHSTAVLMAMKNRMDVAFNIAFESSKQIALFVAPVLVLLAIPFGQPLTLEFSHMEVIGMVLSVAATSLIALDGETNWLEGLMLLGVYAILGISFFYVP